MNSLFQTYFNSFNRINTWGIDLGCSGIGKAENKENISFILPITSILIEIEIEKYIETKEKWSKPIVNFYKNGQQLFSIELLVGGNWFISAFWSNDERFIAITETDQGADHSTIIDIKEQKVLKQFGGYDNIEPHNDVSGDYGSRAILFLNSKAIFLPTISYEEEYCHLKYFDCISGESVKIIDAENISFNDLICEDFCIINDNIICIKQEKVFFPISFYADKKFIKTKKYSFIDIEHLLLKKEIKYLITDNAEFEKVSYTIKRDFDHPENEKMFSNNGNIIIYKDNTFITFKPHFISNRVDVINAPLILKGIWDKGYTMDYHTVSSKKLNDNKFETIRTNIGENLYQLKYNFQYHFIQELALKCVEFIDKAFSSFGLGYWISYQKEIDVIILIPPSDLNRPFQPVLELAQKISELSGIPTNLQYLKKKPTLALKSIDDLQERKEILANAFSVIDKRFKGKTVLLFDDLYRSGETLNAAAKVLKEQGEVDKIYVLTITKTRTKR